MIGKQIMSSFIFTIDCRSHSFYPCKDINTFTLTLSSPLSLLRINAQFKFTHRAHKSGAGSLQKVLSSFMLYFSDKNFPSRNYQQLLISMSVLIHGQIAELDSLFPHTRCPKNFCIFLSAMTTVPAIPYATTMHSISHDALVIRARSQDY